MEHTLSTKHICFIGAGSMAEAMVRGLTSQRIVDAGQISLINRSNTALLQRLARDYGVRIAENEQDKAGLIRQADILIAAVKPKDAQAALNGIRPLLAERQLLISVIAGLSIRTIEQWSGGSGCPVIRTMPNTSSSIGLGATGFSCSAGVREHQKELAVQILQSIGLVREVREEQLDIVTGVSGSGPAYIYYVMEAMMAAGVHGGLSPEAARELTVQTVLGAGQMVRLTGEDPAALRRKVTSPGGTTQAALEVMDAYRLAEGIERAVLRAAERAGEIGAELSGHPQERG